MRAKTLQLVVPSRLHPTYRPAQQSWLMDLGTFLSLVKNWQENAAPRHDAAPLQISRRWLAWNVGLPVRPSPPAL
jgi:hypothetical protein